MLEPQAPGTTIRRTGKTNADKRDVQKELHRLLRVLEADKREEIASDAEFYKRTEHHIRKALRILRRI